MIVSRGEDSARAQPLSKRPAGLPCRWYVGRFDIFRRLWFCGWGSFLQSIMSGLLLAFYRQVVEIFPTEEKRGGVLLSEAHSNTNVVSISVQFCCEYVRKLGSNKQQCCCQNRRPRSDPPHFPPRGRLFLPASPGRRDLTPARSHLFTRTVFSKRLYYSTT